MKFLLFPNERSNKITVRKGKYFDHCVGSVSADMLAVSANKLVVCWPAHY